MIVIYALINPINKDIEYVGKTKNIKQRYRNHCNKDPNKETSLKRNFINPLLEKGLKPELIILDEVEPIRWHFWERYWISQCNSWGFKLLNSL